MNQILKTGYRWVVLACLLAGLFACNEDKGNYDYTDVNTVTIDSIRDQYTYAIGETMRIAPRLTFSEGEEESNFDFVWYYRSGNRWMELQRARNLEIEVGGPFNDPTRTYPLMYQITNKTTEVPYVRLFNLRLTSQMARGFLALCEHDNGFDADLIAFTTADTFQLFDNVFELTGSALPRDGVTPYNVVAFADPLSPDPVSVDGTGYSVYILTDQYATRVKSSDYSWQESYDISNLVERNSYLDREYVQQGKNIVVEKMAYHYNGNPRAVFYVKEPEDGKGNWYLYSSSYSLMLFANPMNALRTDNMATSGKVRFEPAPYVVSPNRFGFLYYDKDAKVFLMQSTDIGSYQSTYYNYAERINETSVSPLFSFNEENEGLLYMEGIQLSNNVAGEYGYAILKKADGSFKYIQFYMRATGTLVQAASKISAASFPAASNIGDAKLFARHPSSNYLYYVTNSNRVYKIDVTNGSSYVDITESVLTEGYSEVTVLKFTLPEIYNSEAKRLMSSITQTLAVGSYNPSLGKEQGGKLQFFLSSNTATGDLELAKYPTAPMEDGYQIDMSWEGLGKIVGLTYKVK